MLLISGVGTGFQQFSGLPKAPLLNNHPPYPSLSAGEQVFEMR